MHCAELQRKLVQGRLQIALTRTFSPQTVTEGMEDMQMMQTLTEMGCRFGQGYGIAYSMPAAEFLEWFRKRKAT